MKVLHVPFCFYPDAPGGTEIYVEALARYQDEMGIESAIAAAGRENASYIHVGRQVYRFRTGPDLSMRALYGEGDMVAASAFAEILESARPDVVHLHAFTSGVSIRLVRAAHGRGIPVVFTYHTPSVSCSRGTLLHWGSEPCEGQMQVRQCAACRLHSKGMPKTVSCMVAALPAQVGSGLAALGVSGSRWTALRASELIGVRHGAVRALLAETECIVAVSQWVKDLLVRNGADPQKIVLSRQGLAGAVGGGERVRHSGGELPLRMAFLGRLDPIKGLDVVIDSLRLVPELQVTLDLFAVTQGDAGEKLKKQLLDKIGGDRRIRFLDAIEPDRIVERLRDYDILVAPSQGLETGPLVVYEAFAAGTPVIGSNLGGIAELVEHGKNGLLVEPASRSAWAAAFGRLVENPQLLTELRRGIGPVRTMRDVASEMLPVYERVQ
jgi:glycosyltransferase involved in cell wall biosynthesis